MFNLLATIILSIVTTVGVYNYVPLRYIEYLDFRKHEQLGSTITTIQSTDRISDSRTTINTNFTNLNDGKIENSTTSVAAITTLANLVTVGTITTGVWSGTTLTVSKGGTGSTTLSQYQVLLGNGTGNVSVVAGLGSSGQFLTSGGAGTPPTWTTSSIDQAGTYTWTGIHNFAKATTTNATSTSLQVSGLASTSQMIVSQTLNIGQGMTIGGVATTTSNPNLRINNNLIVDNNASTTGLVISGTCTGCANGVETTTNTGAGPTSAGSNVAVTASCTGSKRVIGGGGKDTITDNTILFNSSFPAAANNGWTVSYTSATGGSAGNTITAYAICVNP